MSKRAAEPVTADVAIPVPGRTSESASATQGMNITLPGYISAGRIWFVCGTLEFLTVSTATGLSLVEPSVVDLNDPSASVDWSSMELTTDSVAGVTADISFVDFVGLPLGITLETNDPSGPQSAQGLNSTDAISSICDELRNQTETDGQPWDELCVTNGTTDGRPLRVLSPADYIDLNPNAFSGYFEGYVDQVWQYYANNTLTFENGINCNVTDEKLICDGDDQGFQKPTTSDIFGCNTGPFATSSSDSQAHLAVIPRLCSGFNRHTLLSDEAQQQIGDQTGYFTQIPNNWYSSIVHKYEIDGKGYAFAYDDVDPEGGASLSGLVSSANPVSLTVTIGGPSMS